MLACAGRIGLEYIARSLEIWHSVVRVRLRDGYIMNETILYDIVESYRAAMIRGGRVVRFVLRMNESRS